MNEVQPTNNFSNVALKILMENDNWENVEVCENGYTDITSKENLSERFVNVKQQYLCVTKGKD